MDVQAQGWFRDPYGVHQDRYFSAGKPTKLVRDEGREGYDPPPDRPPAEGDLVPVPPAGGEPVVGSDLGRADQPVEDPNRARRAVLDYFDQLPRW